MARACACGWSLEKRDDRKDGRRDWVETCAWKANGRRCAYPVGMFELGSNEGFCVFHRVCTGGADGARIVDQSQGVTPERYLAEVVEMQARWDAASPAVEKIRAGLKSSKPFGSFSDLTIEP